MTARNFVKNSPKNKSHYYAKVDLNSICMTKKPFPTK